MAAPMMKSTQVLIFVVIIVLSYSLVSYPIKISLSHTGLYVGSILGACSGVMNTKLPIRSMENKDVHLTATGASLRMNFSLFVLGFFICRLSKNHLLW